MAWGKAVRTWTRLNRKWVWVSLATLIFGILIGLELEQNQKDRLEITERENLKTQTEVFRKVIQNQVEWIQKQSKSPTSEQLGVRFWADVFVPTADGYGNQPPPVFEETAGSGKIPQEIEIAFTRLVREKLLATANPSVQILPLQQKNYQEWLVFFFADDNLPKWHVVLVDPMILFSAFSQLERKPEVLNSRVYLVSQTGYVMIHSQNAYRGATLSGTDFFKQGIVPQFELKPTTHSSFGHYASIDRLPVLANITRLPGFPLALVVEKIQGDPEQRMEALLRGSQVKSIGKILLLIGFLGAVAGTALANRSRRRKKNSTPSTPSPQWTLPTPSSTTPVIAAPEHLEAALETVAAGFSENLKQSLKNSMQSAPDYELSQPIDFEQANRFAADFQKALVGQSQFGILSLLTECVSHICQSPVLFLRYHPDKEHAILELRSGFDRPQGSLELNIPIGPETRKQIQSSIQANQVPLFTGYQPLAAEVLKRLNIAHIEAWGVTSAPAHGLVTLPFPFAGLVVILQPGVQSTLHQHTVLRVIRAAGVALSTASETARPATPQKKTIPVATGFRPTHDIWD